MNIHRSFFENGYKENMKHSEPENKQALQSGQDESGTIMSPKSAKHPSQFLFQVAPVANILSRLTLR